MWHLAYTRKNAQLVTNLQQTACSQLVDKFALLVPSLLTSCYKPAADLRYKLDELNSLVTSCSNNLLRGCNRQLVNKLWVTKLVQLVKITTLRQLVDKLVTSLLRAQLVDKMWDFYVCTHVKTHMLLQLVIKPLQDLFALLVPSCWQVCTSCYQLVTSLMTIADLLQVCFNKLISSGRNNL